MEKNYISAQEIYNLMWQYSKYYAQLLYECEQSYNSGNGVSAIILLFNLTESVIHSINNDYKCIFKNSIEELYNSNIINKIELDFLSGNNASIRNIRNIYTHRNLSKYNFIFKNENAELMYPLTENTSSLKLYETISYPLLLLLSKIISTSFVKSYCPNIDELINKINIDLKELTVKQVFKLKGFDNEAINKLLKHNIDEDVLLRLADNQADVNIVKAISENLLYK